ncbi:phasin [Tianweitania sediminis]|uniref:Phasin n=1 Tax=Tianweitania sediminis TaxID=1502156 RepID=A0A8J7R660_9HYPH|nr:phasin [Tianweitania sediminis]MBP0438567.1 phasin [Tianweitania sediminis]
MSEAFPKSTETPFPTFDANPAVDQFRAFAEKGMEQSREAYSRFKEGAEDAQKAVEASFENARAVSSELSLKSLAAMRANTELSFSHLEALMGVKTVSDFVELQSSFMRKQMELAMNQAKEIQTVSTKSVEELTRPLKDVVGKNWTDLKVA